MKITSFLAIAAIALAVAALAIDPAMAQASGGGDIFSSLNSKASTTFQNVRTLAFIIAGFGILAIAIMAYFGRFNFKHLAGLIGGLVLLSAAAAMINYVTSGNTGSSTTTFDPSTMNDTFSK